MKHFEAWMVVENAKILDATQTLRHFEKVYNKEPLAEKRLMMLSEYSVYAQTKPSVETILETVEDLFLNVTHLSSIEGNKVIVKVGNGHLYMTFWYGYRLYVEIKDEEQFHVFQPSGPEPFSLAKEELLMKLRNFDEKFSIKTFTEFIDVYMNQSDALRLRPRITRLELKIKLVTTGLFNRKKITRLHKQLKDQKQKVEEDIIAYEKDVENETKSENAYNQLLQDSGLGNILEKLELAGVIVEYKNILHNGDIGF